MAALMEQSKQLVTGINASSSSIKEGKNEHCRLYSYADDMWVDSGLLLDRADG